MAQSPLTQQHADEILQAAPKVKHKSELAALLRLNPHTLDSRIASLGIRSQVTALLGSSRSDDIDISVFSIEDLSERAYAYLRSPRRKAGILLSDLADALDVSPRRAREAFDELEEQGKHVHRSGDVVSAYVMSGSEETVQLDIEPRDKMFIGVVSDTHFGSKKQQPSALYEFMHRAADEYELDCWVHAGDLTDGIPEVYRGHTHEVWITRADDQIDYSAEKFPETGVDTYAIGGNHDESADKRAGVDVLRGMDERREDFHHVDWLAGTVDVGGVSIRLWHPAGGASYAKSHKLQRYAEGFNDKTRPHIILAGHLHQFCWVPHSSTHAFLVPSFQATTRFIRRLGYESMVGGMVLEIERDSFGEPTKLTPHLEWFDHKEKDFPRW